jgi:hypothetical protein
MIFIVKAASAIDRAVIGSAVLMEMPYTFTF